MNLILRDIPDDIHLQFKIACVKKGISMNKRIIELMAEDIKKTDNTKKTIVK
jgi:hydroxymethylpyrimidine/phosphomethylpyrimidine kinase